MNKHALYRKQLDLLALAKKYLSSTCEGNLKNYIHKVRGAIPDLFYENEFNLRREFVELIPVEQLSESRNLLDFLKFISGTSGYSFSGNYKTYSVSVIQQRICQLETTMKQAISIRSHFTVFYCWESDLSKKTNRNYIQSCIEKAIKKLNDECEIKLYLDKDTLGSTGSPDIFPTILRKIDNALVFIADITPVTKLNNKEIPNPNVMCELGYALSSISDERVIMLFNTADGRDPKALPFDLGLKRTMMYEYSENEEKSPAKDELVKKLYEAIKVIRDL